MGEHGENEDMKLSRSREHLMANNLIEVKNVTGAKIIEKQCTHAQLWKHTHRAVQLHTHRVIRQHYSLDWEPQGNRSLQQ